MCSMKKEYSILKKEALTALSSYMDSLGENQGSKLAYWISDYVRFLKREPGFDPKKLIRYKRGAIVKVHLGYRVGSEEGGLHYAVVMDVDNKLSNPVATVIPLTSIKPDTDLDHLHSSKVFLGDEIFVKLLEELKEYQKQTLCLQEDILTQQKALLAQKVDQTPASAGEHQHSDRIDEGASSALQKNAPGSAEDEAGQHRSCRADHHCQ